MTILTTTCGFVVLGLMLAGDVVADCAWVLWEKSQNSSDSWQRRVYWRPDGAYPSVEACNELLARKLQFYVTEMSNAKPQCLPGMEETCKKYKGPRGPYDMKSGHGNQSGYVTYKIYNIYEKQEMIILQSFACYPEQINPNEHRYQ